MTYIHGTTWCQMSCAHCCVDYGNGKRGKHMGFDMFCGAVNYAADNGDHVTLGGGEITLHPKFRNMVMHVMDCTSLSLFMVTNGGKAVNGVSKNVRWLIELMDSGMYEDRIRAELSLDQFHDMVEDDFVENWFKRPRYGVLGWGIGRDMVRRVGDKKLLRAGRALLLDKDMYEWHGDDNQCACENAQIYPDGRVTGCGCLDSPIIAQIVHHGYDNLLDVNAIRDSGSGCCSPSKLAAKAKIEEQNEKAVNELAEV